MIIAGISTRAPKRHEPMEIITRYPKNLIDINPENTRGKNPAITVKAFIMMLRPIMVSAALVDSSYDRPCLLWLWKDHIYWMVKSTPTPIIIDESRAVALSILMPVNPMKPNKISTDEASGIMPIRPPRNDRNIIVSSSRTATSANAKERTCPFISDRAISAMIMA